MPLQELLTELSEAHGVSGYEERVREIVVRAMDPYADEVHVTRLGSVIGVKRATRLPAASNGHKNGRGQKSTLEAKRAPRLLIEAHMDEIGFVVSVLDGDFIRFVPVGGFDERVLLAQNVLVHGQETLPGIIGARPPHLLTAEERQKPVPMRDLFIDVGLPAVRLRELVNLGDMITLDRKVAELKNGRLAGKAFDDRAGIATVVEALRRLQGTSHVCDVYAVANVNEEDSEHYLGAATSTFEISPDAAIALDAAFADQPGVGDVTIVPLGKGPGIALGPNVHPRMHARLVELAEQHEIPHRITAYAGSTGTNAVAIQVAREGVPTGLLDLPVRYMHTSVETLAVQDLERAARLLALFATSLEPEFFNEFKSAWQAPAVGSAVQPARKSTPRARQGRKPARTVTRAR